MEQTQPGSSQRCMAAGQEAVAQADIQEAQAGGQKPFPHKNSPEWGWVSILGDFTF